jgi:hypothetical protein
VKIVEIPARAVAVLQFSGSWSSPVFKKQSRELLEELAKARVSTAGLVFSMRYNGPMISRFLRKNEVAVAVDLKSTVSS